MGLNSNLSFVFDHVFEYLRGIKAFSVCFHLQPVVISLQQKYAVDCCVDFELIT